MKRRLWIIIFFLCLPMAFTFAQENRTPTEPGKSFAFQFDMGTMGSFSMFEAGIYLPSTSRNFYFGFKARATSSLTWATYVDYTTGQMTSFHPVLIGGVITFGGFSPMIHDMFRAYGGVDILAGTTFTPYDDAINGTGNLIGDNLTYGIYGFFGVELFTAPKISVYLDSGGGFKNFITQNKTDINVIAASWLGSGFSIRMGMRFYL